MVVIPPSLQPVRFSLAILLHILAHPVLDVIVDDEVGVGFKPAPTTPP